MRRLLPLLLILAMVLSMAACAKEAPAGQTPTAPSSQGEPAAAPDETPIPIEEAVPDIQLTFTFDGPISYPLTVTDQAGREVTIPQEPQRIISGCYMTTSLMLALGQKERLVAIEEGAHPLYQQAAPELLSLPRIGADLSGCTALQPDLVLLPVSMEASAEELIAQGIAVVLVNPENQKISSDWWNLIAAVLNRQEEAENLSFFVFDQSRFLEDMLQKADRPTVYLAGKDSLLTTVGSGSYQHSLLVLGGGRNVAAELTGSSWTTIDESQLKQWNPSYIILSSEAGYGVEAVLGNKKLAEVDAVKNGQVYQLPGNPESWDSPVPGSILGALWLADVLHEEVTPEDAFSACSYFYQSFYGIHYEEASVE